MRTTEFATPFTAGGNDSVMIAMRMRLESGVRRCNWLRHAEVSANSAFIEDDADQDRSYSGISCTGTRTRQTGSCSGVAFGDESYKLQVQIEGTCPMPSGRWCPQLPGNRVTGATMAVELASLAVPTPDVAGTADRSKTTPHVLRARLSVRSSR
jgi:hypothetical protein